MLGAAACPVSSPVGAAGWSVPSGSVVPAAAGSTIALFGQPPAQQAHAPGAAPFAHVKIDYVSPSAIETFAMCERKWAWTKLDREAKTEGKAALLGTAVHSQHEAWLKHGTPYDLTKHEGEIAQATLHLLPPPGVANVEGEMTFVYNGVKYGGKLDGEWIEQAGQARIASHPPTGLEQIEHLWRAVVLDHKTGNKDFFKLAKEQLIKHPQAPIYAARAFLKWQTPIVELRWNYATTDKKPKPFPSWHVVRPEEVHAVWDEHVERPAKRMLAVIEQANSERRAGRPFGAMQLRPNFDACRAFGGCPFRTKCAPTGQQEMQAHMTQVNVQQQQTEFLTRVLGVQPGGAPAAAPQAQFNQPPAYAPPVVQQAPAGPPPAMVRGTPNSVDPNYVYDGQGSWMLATQFLAEQHAAQHVQTSPIPQVAQASAFPPANPMTQAAAALPPQMAQGYGGQINPPEAHLPPAVVAQAQAAAAPLEPEAKPEGKGKKVAKKSDEPSFAEAVYVATLRGLYSNPNALGYSDEQIAARAKAAAALVSA